MLGTAVALLCSCVTKLCKPGPMFQLFRSEQISERGYNLDMKVNGTFQH